MARGHRKRVLLRLYKQANGICSYCGIKTIIRTPEEDNEEYHASIEHLYPKTDIRRYAQENNFDYTVLACRGCNHKMNELNKHLTAQYAIFDSDFSLIKIFKNGGIIRPV